MKIIADKLLIELLFKHLPIPFLTSVIWQYFPRKITWIFNRESLEIDLSCTIRFESKQDFY